MSTTTVTPTDDADRISREHHAIRELIDSIAARLTDIAKPNGVQADLANLADQLAAHFASEEKAGGLYAQILDQDARFGPEIERLTEDHAKLVELLQEIRSADTPAAELPGAFDRFRQMLSGHERDENRLMLLAYTDEIGSKD